MHNKDLTNFQKRRQKIFRSTPVSGQVGAIRVERYSTNQNRHINSLLKASGFFSLRTRGRND